MSTFLLRLALLGFLVSAPIAAWEGYGWVSGNAASINPERAADHDTYTKVAAHPVYVFWHRIVIWTEPGNRRPNGLPQASAVLLFIGALTRRR